MQTKRENQTQTTVIELDAPTVQKAPPVRQADASVLDRLDAAIDASAAQKIENATKPPEPEAHAVCPLCRTDHGGMYRRREV